MILIYTHQVTNRVKYIFNVIFNSILGIDYTLTADPEYFRKFEEAKISYTKKPIGDEIFFESSNLLFESGISLSNPLLDKMKMDDKKDFFALSFFLVSRYEEYLPFAEDEYGRFSAKDSFAYKNDFLHKPMVNIWAKEVRRMISVRYPTITFPEKQYKYIPTVDIDGAYSYLGKSLKRTLGGYAKAIVTFDIDDLFKRKSVLSGKEKDPYDTYDLQFDLHKKYHLNPIYFFLLGDWAPNDKNHAHTNPLMRSLVKNISEKADVGMHPSFASNQYPEKIQIERERLGNITNTSVKKSRQHFLMLRFPTTYKNLIAAGITDDYTMGYADEVGFRAGICTPYRYYNLKKEEETNLTIHPFAVMDGTLNKYLKLSQEQALLKIKNIAKEIKDVDGEFISIWHNATLSDWREWKGWKGFYEALIQIATSAK